MAPRRSEPAQSLVPDTTASLVLRGVTRRHAGRSVWAPLDLHVAPGTLTVVTGGNGAGKTTLLRVAAGLLQLSSGTRWCAGRALYVRGGGGLRSAQTVMQAVVTTAELAGCRGEAGPALELLGAAAFADRRVGTLSAGERVRVALAAAAAAQPAVLCLDEPTAALDDAALETLTGALTALAGRGCSLLVATHQPAALLLHADAHVRVGGGRVVAA